MKSALLVLFILSISTVQGFLGFGKKKHCSDVTPCPLPAAPFSSRWYVYALTSCYDDSSTKFRYGLFYNKVSKCDCIDFYSDGKSYVKDTAAHFIDYCYNQQTKNYDETVFDYYLTSDSKDAIFVAETISYYDGKPMVHEGSKSSSSSSEEKKAAASSGRQKFFFSCIDDTPDYKIFYVCTKFDHLSKGKPLVWILTRTHTPTQVTIDSIKASLVKNKITFYDSLTFVDHSGCKYNTPKEKYGSYTYIKA